MKTLAHVLAVLVLSAGSVLAQDVSQASTASTTPTTPSTPSSPTTTGSPSANAAERAGLVIQASNQNDKPVEGAAITVERPKTTDEMVTDDHGRAHSHVRRETEFTVTIKADGYAPLTFKRKLGKEADWALARVKLFPPQLGQSYVAEFRIGRTSDKENPERDFAKFNFHVAYYKDHSAIVGASIVLHREDGKVVRRITTDDAGNADILIREGTVFNVKVKADGYAEYTTRLSPGLLATSRHVAILLRKNP